jgi:signal peptidase II
MIGPSTKRLILLAVTLLTIGCDQATKHLAATHLAGQPPRRYLADTVRVHYVENPGAFLGLGAGLPPWARTSVFTVGTSIALLLMAAAGLRGTWTTLQLLGFGLFWAGGVSNLIDRALYGRVSDFLNVGIGSLRTGIFNVADMVIMLGLVLVVVDHARGLRRGRQAP